MDDSIIPISTGHERAEAYSNEIDDNIHGPYFEPFTTSAFTSNTSGKIQAVTINYIDTYYIYSFDGKLLSEYDQSGACVRDYIYAGTRLIAEYRPQTSKYYYYMSDQINSTRIITDDAGSVVYSEAYGPYGDVQKTWTKTYDPKQKFSGKEREGYSELDYFGARYFDNNSYRFISVDPIINKEEALSNPQLWNLYAYCRNNPITKFDPDGQSEKDVKLIFITYRDEVIRMTQNNERNSSPIWNGISGTIDLILGNEPYKSCVFQEQNVREKLLEKSYDDKWNFSPDTIKVFGLPIHTYGIARSDNPDDPIIKYDPFKDNFCVSYAGRKDGEKRFTDFSNFVERQNETNTEKLNDR
ncbi:MAG: RHS repeat-associated core domain-containing protein [Acidobacteria bacterium]|nr:RHS repeat-associated core domain-containing protein [Acidobacteriota bacterium]